MSTLTSKQISQTYKQLLKINVSANTGVTGDLQNIQSGDGTNSALQISTSVINVAGKFGVSEDASVSGDLLVGSKVCASAFYGDGSNLTGITFTGDVSVSSFIQSNSTPSSMAFSCLRDTYNNEAGLSPTVIAVKCGSLFFLVCSRNILLLILSSCSATGAPYSICSIFNSLIIMKHI